LLICVAAGAHAQDVARGKELYDGVCQSCHGPDGEGDGPGAAEFLLRPRPFSQAAFKFDTDADWQKGTDQDLADVIRKGAAAYGGSSMMAPWPSLSDDQISSLIAYIRSLEPGRPEPAAADVTFSGVYELLSTHCRACHVKGIADGPWSLDTPPRDDYFAECLDEEPSNQLRCTTWHQLVEVPAPDFPAWVQPADPEASAPYVQACNPADSFHIGHSMPEKLPDADCAALLGWIEAGAPP
jgi:mono/diheme cytochrome c family protein